MRSSTRYRVLCVDDNLETVVTLATVLDLCGFEARACTDGLAALEEFELFVPDACILDIIMPGLDGYELARRMRSKAVHRPLVLLAASGANGPECEARAAGFDATYAKPVDPQAIIDLLSHLLDQAFRTQPTAFE
jgi:CheY-like chemotaxis protein